MKQNQRLITYCLLTLFFVLVTVAPTCGSLQSSVRKYKNSVVSRNAIAKLARYDHLIRYFSGLSYFVPKHKVSPNFIRALILAESGANHRAVSKKNAMGLGQIILTTGEQAGKELARSQTNFRYVSKSKLRNLNKNDLFEPAINILLTCYLVAKYNYKFDGKLELVVSAWNAGENTKSLSRGRHAPYKETENLIGKVNAYYVYLLKNRPFPN
jgi:soluble lytic murein transglycosylase-like protein